VEQRDLAVRKRTYGLFVVLGRAPTTAEVAAEVGWSADDVQAGWERLYLEHALVLQPDTREIRMASPFSGVPTESRVHAADRWWYANCAWDAFGICAALHVDGRIETSCPDSGEPLVIEVCDKRPDDESLLFHCLVPASHWWDDIVFS
jgi:hypothetical protein